MPQNSPRNRDIPRNCCCLSPYFRRHVHWPRLSLADASAGEMKPGSFSSSAASILSTVRKHAPCLLSRPCLLLVLLLFVSALSVSTDVQIPTHGPVSGPREAPKLIARSPFRVVVQSGCPCTISGDGHCMFKTISPTLHEALAINFERIQS